MSDVSSNDYLNKLGQDEDHGYAIIRFKHKGPLKKLEDIDLVPTDWLGFNDKGSLTCKYLASMEKKENVKLLRDLVKRNGPAPPDWPTYPVQAIGRAHNYKEGLVKLKNSTACPTVFITDSEAGEVEAEKALISQIKRKNLRDEFETLKRKFQECMDERPGPSKKTTKPNRSANSNYETGQSSSKLHENISNLDDDKDNASHGSDTSITPPVENFEQSETVASSNSAIDSSSQSHSSWVDDENSTDKENTPATLPEKSGSTSALIIPVINLTDTECKNDFERAVMLILTDISNKLGDLEKDVKEISKRQKELKVLFNQLKSDKKTDCVDFSEKNGIELPIKTKEAFTKFNDNLSTNDLLRKDLYTAFKSFWSDDAKLTVIMGLILRKFVSREVLSHYTAIKGSSSASSETDHTDETDKNEKDSFEPPQFCKCMYGFLRVSRKKLKKDCTDSELRTALSGVFSNARKWKS